MERTIFYTHQTSGACAGVCACNRTHQMERTDSQVIINQHNFKASIGGPQEPAYLVTLTEEILNGKLHFLCSV